MGNIKKKQNHELHVSEKKKQGRRLTWKSSNGVTKTEIEYILTNRPDTVTDVTIINHIYIGCDNRMVMSKTKLNVQVERNEI